MSRNEGGHTPLMAWILLVSASVWMGVELYYSYQNQGNLGALIISVILLIIIFANFELVVK